MKYMGSKSRHCKEIIPLIIYGISGIIKKVVDKG